jgi:signal transduction histidine kinase/DNA-binding response OmpR family regulator/CHASE3 domain sensor protein
MSPESADASAEFRTGARSGAPLPPGPLLGLATAVIAVAFISLLTYRALEARSAAARRVTHTLETVDQLEAVLSLVKDAETGQRGFLLSGEESYLEPYINAKSQLPAVLKRARGLLADDPQQAQRLTGLEQLAAEKITELEQTIALRRKGEVAAAVAQVRTDHGKVLMDRVRSLITTLESTERADLVSREEAWQQSESVSSAVTFGGSAILLVLIAAAAVLTSRDYRARQILAWLRAGQMAFGQRIQGEQRLERLADHVLSFLAAFLGARVGSLYISEGTGMFRRIAGYALPAKDSEAVRAGEGLLGQAAKENRPLRVGNVPEGYLPVSSTLGHANPAELLVAPAATDGTIQAVVELGFFRRLRQEDLDLMSRISESLGVAVRASKDRTRLEELLEETQRQGEELQTQQEELRVTNEELEVQARTLKESQGQLESQHAELEQTNSQLEEQAQLLEHQRDELSQAQAVLAAKAADLERANQYKSEFLANMSHELRTPLNSSLILAKILADNRTGNLTPDQVKYAQTISSAGNDLLAIINDILDLSKIEAGKVELSPQAVALPQLIEELLAGFQALAQSKGLYFKATVGPEAPAMLETDPQRLGQILRNLISNALKFTESGGVSVRVIRGAGDTARFEVRDTGIGISEHQQEIIFDAFRQADGSTHRKYGGTGLGLTISRDLARLLGGDISVVSAPGQGSTFLLTLPLSYNPTATARVNPTPAAPVISPRPVTDTAPKAPLLRVEDDSDRLKADSRLILIVEDDPPFATILRDLAHELGFQCIITHTANDALAAVATYRPKAILLDMNLPDYSGLGVLDQLKRSPQMRHIPVHVVSVADYSQEALAMGAIGYAMKPVKREQLIEALQRLEAKFSQGMRRVLVVEDDERQRESICQLLQNEDVNIIAVRNAADGLAQLQEATFDCMVMDLNLPDFSGYELLKRMAEAEEVAFPPVIVYTGRSLTRDEEQGLRRFSKSIIIKDARSPERLLDEVTLFLHQVEAKLPAERQRMLQAARDRDSALEGRCILVVEDDVRNIFALSSLLEPKGASIEIARNGREAIDSIIRSTAPGGKPLDLVLMDIMMPEMDGLTAMREIRKRPEWKKLPIIALTAKAMKDDQEKCLSAGASDYIAKPLDVEKLMSLIRVWLPK